MGSIKEEIENAASEVGAHVVESKIWTGTKLQVELARRFGSSSTVVPLWERLRKVASIQDAQGWRVPAEIIGRESCLLSFEPCDEETVFELQYGSELSAILNRCFGFVFYVTDPEISYLLCFNDHDFIIGVGSVLGWFRKRGARQQVQC